MRVRVLLVGLYLIGWGGTAWADYQQTPGTRFDSGALCEEFDRVVPEVASCDETSGTITVRRERGDFTVEERNAMDAVLSTHDPESRSKRQVQRLTKKRAMLNKLCQGAGLTGQDLQVCQDELVGD